MAGTFNKYNIAIIFFVALGSFTYGFNSAIIGSVYGLASFLDYFGLNAVGDNAARANHLLGGLFKFHPTPNATTQGHMY